MRLAVSRDRETIENSKVIPTPADFNQGIEAFKQVYQELSGEEKVTGISGGIAGPLNKEKSMLIASPHIGGWIQKPLKNELEKAFETEVQLENDTALVGLGEATKGAGNGYSIVAYLGIGTGIGGVRIVDRKIDNNALGFEPGHQIVVPDGNHCTCGGKGHLETYISGSYFPGLYQKKGEEITDPGIWDEVAKYTAIGLNNVIVHWSPDIVVLGGAVSQSIPLDKVEVYLKENLKVFPELPQVVKATLGQDAGLYGALELLKY